MNYVALEKDTLKWLERLFLTIFDNYLIAIFNQPKKRP